jgi:hypothetical protein
LNRAIERRLSAIANRCGLSLAIVGLLALSSSALPYLLYSRSIQPFSYWSFFSAYDELSYLLAADTYASGRLTNPTHPMWRHFETRSVNHVPTYQSMYPPAQGAFLALGQRLTGHPIVGAWISMALACVATCWLLQAWFPPRWALLGALLTALHVRMALEWGGTYWGGAVAMLGGALLFGGLRRILERARVRDSILFAVGLAVLANTRPFEGFVASVPAMAVLARWVLLSSAVPPRIRFTRVVAPILAVLALAAAGMGYYNDRVTRSPWTLPYQAYLAAHPAETPFTFQMTLGDAHPEESASRDDLQHRPRATDPASRAEPSPYQDWWVANLYMKLLTSPVRFVRVSFKLAIQWAFYFGPILTLPLLALPWCIGTPWTKFALFTSALTLFAVLTTSAGLPHYLAPVAPLLIVLVVQGSRSLALWRRRGSRTGRRWVPALMVLWPLELLLMVALFPTLLSGLRWSEPRARLRAELERMEGNHLVIVRYGRRHVFYQEWVGNEADIDGAKVVWARELAPDSTRELLDYFRGRRVWLVEPDRKPALVPYEPPALEMSQAEGRLR